MYHKNGYKIYHRNKKIYIFFYVISVEKILNNHNYWIIWSILRMKLSNNKQVKQVLR